MSHFSLLVCLLGIAAVGVDGWNFGRCTDSVNVFPLFYLRPFYNRCYALITSKLNWWDAQRFCRYLDHDAFLVVISSMTELNWINSHIASAPGYSSSASYWTGGRRISGNTWQWAKFNIAINMGRPPWASGEPNGNGWGLAIDRTGAGWRFYDRDRNTKYHFICEVPRSRWGPSSALGFRAAGAAAETDS